MRESILHALNAELARQAVRTIGALDLGAVADAILADLPAAIPAAQLVERLRAIAEKMEGAMTVEVEEVGQLIIESDHPLTDEQATRVSETLRHARPFKGVVLDGGLRVRGKVLRRPA